jgi:hypothetical protein
MRCGEMRMGGRCAGWRYVGESDDNGRFEGRGELSLPCYMPRGRRLDVEWEGGWVQRGIVEESDGAVYQVVFEGMKGVCRMYMDRALNEKLAYRDRDRLCGKRVRWPA